ncbi:MAG: ComF family protein [bacterium]
MAVFPVVAYEGAAREAIHLLKYDGKTDLARPLGEMMALHALDELGDFAFDCVVPVPLSLRRLRQRGYNQSLLLALEVGRHLRKPVLDVLARIRDTVPQSDLGSEERRKNVRGAFAVKSPEDIAEKIVMLVDDIFTTGATADECAFALRIAGAKSVYVFALSRA